MALSRPDRMGFPASNSGNEAALPLLYDHKAASNDHNVSDSEPVECMLVYETEEEVATAPPPQAPPPPLSPRKRFVEVAETIDSDERPTKKQKEIVCDRRYVRPEASSSATRTAARWEAHAARAPPRTNAFSDPEEMAMEYAALDKTEKTKMESAGLTKAEKMAMENAGLPKTEIMAMENAGLNKTEKMEMENDGLTKAEKMAKYAEKYKSQAAASMLQPPSPKKLRKKDMGARPQVKAMKKFAEEEGRKRGTDEMRLWDAFERGQQLTSRNAYGNKKLSEVLQSVHPEEAVRRGLGGDDGFGGFKQAAPGRWAW